MSTRLTARAFIASYSNGLQQTTQLRKGRLSAASTTTKLRPVPSRLTARMHDDNSTEETTVKQFTTANGDIEVIDVNDMNEQLAELDTIAEAWIGSNISRWEWYERFRSRRTKMMATATRKSAKIDEDLHHLVNSLMELDDALGTKLLNDDTSISPMGWTFLFALMLVYVCVGYALVHGSVYAFYTFMSTNGNSFP